MYVIKPIATDLASTNVADATETEWSSVTAYVANDLVKVTLESDGVTAKFPHKIYKSLSSNTDMYPPDSIDDWLDMGATNRHKMFDSFVSSVTSNTGTIDVTLNASKQNKLVLLNMSGSQVQIIVRDSGSNTIQDDTINLVDIESGSWNSYFFSEYNYKDSIIHDIPALYLNMTVQVILTGHDGIDAEIGHCMVGLSHELGSTEHGADSSIVDYSRKTTNDFGETEFVQRDFAKTLDIDLYIEHDTEASQYNYVHRVLSDIRSTPVLFDANNDTNSDREPFIIYGFFKDFSLVADYATKSHCSLSIEGLI